jgi:plasmid maintenance system antidote protein VapI
MPSVSTPSELLGATENQPAVSPNVTPCHTCEANSTTSKQPRDDEGAATNDPSARAVVEEREALTAQQFQAIELVLLGKKDREVAEAVGVSRRTIIRWRLEDADFIAELHRRRRELCDGSADRLRRLLDPSIDVLTQFLNNRYDMHRFRAATTILRLANVRSVVQVKEKSPAPAPDE